MTIPGKFGFYCPSGFIEEAFWNIFPIGSNVKLSPVVVAILNNLLFSIKIFILVTLVANHCPMLRMQHLIVFTLISSGSHLGIPINIKHTKFVKDLPMIDAQFRFNQCNSFREENISVFSHMVLC
jgi:hypothetical protein